MYEIDKIKKLAKEQKRSLSPDCRTIVKPFFELRVIFRGRNFKEGKQKKPGNYSPAFLMLLFL